MSARAGNGWRLLAMATVNIRTYVTDMYSMSFWNILGSDLSLRLEGSFREETRWRIFAHKS